MQPKVKYELEASLVSAAARAYNLLQGAHPPGEVLWETYEANHRDPFVVIRTGGPEKFLKLSRLVLEEAEALQTVDLTG